LAARVGRNLLAAGRSVVTAESCTGGWIAKTLTDIAGSSEWFGEGFVTYSNEAKIRRLGVPRSLLEATVRSARQRCAQWPRRARSIRRAIAVAVSGIAGPGGATPGKPVGTVWLCWAVRRGRACIS
jgi:nicotinamide-nucleotide amidase